MIPGCPAREARISNYRRQAFFPKLEAPGFIRPGSPPSLPFRQHSANSQRIRLPMTATLLVQARAVPGCTWQDDSTRVVRLREDMPR